MTQLSRAPPPAEGTLRGQICKRSVNAIFYSLVVSCKNLGIDPFVYLSDVLERLPTHPPEQIADLTPKAWLDAQQAGASSAEAA